MHDSAIKGKKRIMSMVNSLTAPIEIGAPMACLYLINGSCFYWSHPFVNLYFTQTLKLFLNEERIPVTAIATNDESDPSIRSYSSCINPQIIDYLYRDPKLKKYSYYDFIRNFKKKKSTKGFRFSDSHVQHKTHSLFKISTQIPVVVVFGSRLPNISADDLSDNEQLLFYQMMLILFKPFTSFSDLPSHDSTLDDWKLAYDSWTLTPVARSFLDNNLDYYENNRSSIQQKDRSVKFFESLSNDLTSLDFNDEEDIKDSTNENFSVDNVQFDNDEDYVDAFINNLVMQNIQNNLIDNTDQLQSALNFFIEKVRYKFNINLFKDYDSLLQDTSLNQLLNSEIKESVSQINNLNNNVNFSYSKETFVEQLIFALDSFDWEECSNAPIIYPSSKFPSLAMISKHFKLNFKQHKIFISVALKFFESISASLDLDFEQYSLHKYFVKGQLFGFLAGGAGFGKSEVIKALLFLAKSWGYEGSILTSAYTGIASVNVWGQTLHSLYNWAVDDNLPTQKINLEKRTKFASLRILIIDEISMLPQHFLGRIDESLKLLRRISNTLADVHILMVGDWLQQSPIFGSPLYKVPNIFSTKDQDTLRLRQIGFSIYQSINCVVQLDKNMRHTINSTSSTWFPSLLERLRFGEISESDLEKLNDICYYSKSNSPLIPNTSFETFCPLIVSSHALRVSLNSQMMRLWSSNTSTPLYEFNASIFLQSGFQLTPIEKKSLQNIYDNKTENLPVKLRLGLGMPVMCTVNLAPNLKLCNGSIGHVVYIKHNASNQIQLESDGELFISKCSHIPDFILSKVWKIDHEFFPGLGAGVVPVQPYRNNRVSIDLPSRNVTVRMIQIPLVPAFSLLIEKVQGLTMDSVILGPLRHKTRTSPQRTALHVSCTRVKDAINMRFLQPLTMEDIAYFTPAPELILETRRLEKLELPD